MPEQIQISANNSFTDLILNHSSGLSPFQQVYLHQKLLGIIGTLIFLKEENIQQFCSNLCYYFVANPGYTIGPCLSSFGIYTHVADGETSVLPVAKLVRISSQFGFQETSTVPY